MIASMASMYVYMHDAHYNVSASSDVIINFGCIRTEGRQHIHKPLVYALYLAGPRF